MPNGTHIWFKGADDPDSLYGEDVYAGVFDEASRAKSEAWYAFRSTLTATSGPARLIGNVKGRKNWFYKGCRNAESGMPNSAYHKITSDDSVAAGIMSAEEIADARRNLPENVFKELYMAEATVDGSNPLASSSSSTHRCRVVQADRRMGVGSRQAAGLDRGRRPRPRRHHGAAGALSELVARRQGADHRRVEGQALLVSSSAWVTRSSRTCRRHQAAVSKATFSPPSRSRC